MMKRAEKIICFLWIGLALWVCMGSLGLGLGTFSDPGPGFLPFGTAALLGILAIVHLINVTIRPLEQIDAHLLWVNVHWYKGIYIVISLFAYVFLLPKLGYLLDTFLLMLFLFTILERKKWWVILSYSLFVIGFSYLIFSRWLMVQFPKGFLGIG